MKRLPRYREMIADGNPAELLAAKGEALWKTKRGPKNATLEQCDFGLGPGKLEGAYAQLPRYFKDTGKVMDVESRLCPAWRRCRASSPKEVTNASGSRVRATNPKSRRWSPSSAPSRTACRSMSAHPPGREEDVRDRRDVFYRRSGPQDFSCSICHGQDGKRIRLQELRQSGNQGRRRDGMENLAVLSRVQGAFWTMERRLIDCMRQHASAEPNYGSDSIIALQVYLQKKAKVARWKRRASSAEGIPHEEIWFAALCAALARSLAREKTPSGRVQDR